MKSFLYKHADEGLIKRVIIMLLRIFMTILKYIAICLHIFTYVRTTTTRKGYDWDKQKENSLESEDFFVF